MRKFWIPLVLLFAVSLFACKRRAYHCKCELHGTALQNTTLETQHGSTAAIDCGGMQTQLRIQTNDSVNCTIDIEYL